MIDVVSMSMRLPEVTARLVAMASILSTSILSLREQLGHHLSKRLNGKNGKVIGRAEMNVCLCSLVNLPSLAYNVEMEF
jgi:hypothetical protein